MVVLFFFCEENFYKEEWLRNSEGEGGLKGDGKNSFFLVENRFFFYTVKETINCPRHESFFVSDMSFKFDTTMIPLRKISWKCNVEELPVQKKTTVNYQSEYRSMTDSKYRSCRGHLNQTKLHWRGRKNRQFWI